MEGRNGKNMGEKPVIHSKSNILKIMVFFLVVLLIAFILASYLIDDEFRNQIDSRILRKEVSENSSRMIEINSDTNPSVYAYDKYIMVLSKNVLTFYNQEANVCAEVDVNITTPLVVANDKYFVLAENGGNKLYLINNMDIRWEKEIDGEIYRVSVNKNGYISVILKNTTYKSIVVVYDLEGTELFRTYLATSAICSEISDNNQYLAIGQIDYSGTIVKSIVKLISIEEVQNKSQNSIVYTYESESSKILNNIKFNSKNEAICMFDSYIQKITSSTDERLYDINENSIFVDINLENDIVIIEKEATGLFSYTYQVNIKDTAGKSDNLYILENEIPKKLKVTKDFICINLVGEVRIVNASGWLMKRYTTNSEIQDIVLGSDVMGIVYHNKIEVINI